MACQAQLERRRSVRIDPVAIARIAATLSEHLLLDDPSFARARDEQERAEKAGVRKGRENYLCLLNFEEAAKRTALAPGPRSVALGLIARWALSGSDGDISGMGFPAFLAAAMPLSVVTDRRGECIYSACEHYKKCFVERTIRRARTADIVIANHALVMVQAAMGGLDDATRPTRYVFDEGHHLFDAADSAFSAHLSGLEAVELRRWVRGPEGGRHRRTRGLEQRAGDLVSGHTDAESALVDAIRAAACDVERRFGEGDPDANARDCRDAAADPAAAGAVSEPPAR